MNVVLLPVFSKLNALRFYSEPKQGCMKTANVACVCEQGDSCSTQVHKFHSLIPPLFPLYLRHVTEVVRFAL